MAVSVEFCNLVMEGDNHFILRWLHLSKEPSESSTARVHKFLTSEKFCQLRSSHVIDKDESILGPGFALRKDLYEFFSRFQESAASWGGIILILLITQGSINTVHVDAY